MVKIPIKHTEIHSTRLPFCFLFSAWALNQISTSCAVNQCNKLWITALCLIDDIEDIYMKGCILQEGTMKARLGLADVKRKTTDDIITCERVVCPTLFSTNRDSFWIYGKHQVLCIFYCFYNSPVLFFVNFKVQVLAENTGILNQLRLTTAGQELDDFEHARNYSK